MKLFRGQIKDMLRYGSGYGHGYGDGYGNGSGYGYGDGDLEAAGAEAIT